MPLKSFSIDISGYDNIRIFTNKECNKFILNLMDIDSDYKMDVCSLNETISNNIIMIEQSNLINNYLKFAPE